MKINKLPYEIFSQNGTFAGQTVPHVHFHLIPKSDKNGVERRYCDIRST